MFIKFDGESDYDEWTIFVVRLADLCTCRRTRSINIKRVLSFVMCYEQRYVINFISGWSWSHRLYLDSLLFSLWSIRAVAYRIVVTPHFLRCSFHDKSHTTKRKKRGRWCMLSSQSPQNCEEIGTYVVVKVHDVRQLQRTHPIFKELNPHLDVGWCIVPTISNCILRRRRRRSQMLNANNARNILCSHVPIYEFNATNGPLERERLIRRKGKYLQVCFLVSMITLSVSLSLSPSNTYVSMKRSVSWPSSRKLLLQRDISSVRRWATVVSVWNRI